MGDHICYETILTTQILKVPYGIIGKRNIIIEVINVINEYIMR